MGQCSSERNKEELKLNMKTNPYDAHSHDYVLGAPKASGILSMEYLRLLMYMMGTPGTCNDRNGQRERERERERALL